MKFIRKPFIILDKPHVNIPFHVGKTYGRIMSLTETHVFIDFEEPKISGWFNYLDPIANILLDNLNLNYYNLLENGPKT